MNASDIIIESLRARVSVRAFTDELISAEDERIILEAACQAPTAGNQQLYTIIVVRDPDKRKALAESCDHQPFIAQAPLVLVFCADVRRWHRAFSAAQGCEPRNPGVGDALLACVDATIAAQNAVVAAQALGIGSCYIGDIIENAETQREILALPDHVMPACMLVMGHPTKQQLRRQKPRRFDLDTVVCVDGYRDTPEGELLKAIDNKLRGGKESIAAFCDRKWNSDFSREMTRSAKVWLDGFPFEDVTH
jgi:nitroreductase/FMN reductase (NADPH)/FMN reductase [NAD(P)H]